MSKKLLTICSLFLGLNSTCSYAVLMTEVSENAYITVDGYDVAWATETSVMRFFCARFAPEGQADLTHGVESCQEGRNRQHDENEGMHAKALGCT